MVWMALSACGTFVWVTENMEKPLHEIACNVHHFDHPIHLQNIFHLPPCCPADSLLEDCRCLQLVGPGIVTAGRAVWKEGIIGNLHRLIKNNPKKDLVKWNRKSNKMFCAMSGWAIVWNAHVCGPPSHLQYVLHLTPLLSFPVAWDWDVLLLPSTVGSWHLGHE